MMLSASIEHGRSTATLSATWFDQVARAEGADAAKAIVFIENKSDRAKRLAIAAKKSQPKLAVGDVEGFAKAIARAVAADVKRQATNTTVFNAAKNGCEFAWIPGGGETCAFCIMLASNGWVRASKETALGQHAEHIHDNCMCEFAIRFNDDTKYSSYDASKYEEMYKDADGGNWQAKVKSMRRDLYQENKDTINAQHRERYAALHQTEE